MMFVLESMDNENTTVQFEQARPRLWGLAYRMLGSASDADDAVQDTFVKWASADHEEIVRPEAWLTTACTRRCVDMLRAAHRSRVDYVGPWLPEPLIMDSRPDARETAALAESLSTAFLLLLERLNPVERAAYLLREVFGMDYDEVAATVDKSPTACRQIVSRARKRVGTDAVMASASSTNESSLFEAFLAAIEAGAVEPLREMLADEVELWTDGGGKVLAARRVIEGRRRVAAFLVGARKRFWTGVTMEPRAVNGSPGCVLRDADGIVGVVSLTASPSGGIGGVYIMRNPEKIPPL